MTEAEALKLTAPKAELSEDDDGSGLCHASPADSSPEKKNLPLKCLKFQRRVDTESLWKHLWQSRKLVLAVKQGSSYFHLLKEQEVQEEHQREQRRRKERRDQNLQPPSFCSESESDSEAERWCVKAGVSSSLMKWSRRRRSQTSRPFTPVHQSLTSHQPQQITQEQLYRQLCCLCWLLETLTVENSGRVGPVTSCWDAKDPGRSRNTLKTLNKEKAIQVKWEQFVSPPKSVRPVLRVSRICSARPSTRKSSSLSVTSSSMVVTSSLSSSLSSLVPDSKDDGEALSTETEPPVSEYLQKLLEEVHKSVAKDLYGSEENISAETDRSDILRRISSLDSAVAKNPDTPRPKSSSTRQPSSSTSAFSYRKTAKLSQIKLAFEDRAEELALNLTDALDRSAKKRWMDGVQRYQSLSSVSSSRCLSASGSSVTFTPNQQSEVTDRPYSTHWLSSLLSSLPLHTLCDSRCVCVMEKLQYFVAERVLRVRPHIFLRVLNSLQLWELCCPEMCVAIEIVRVNAVGMSVEEFDYWLHGRVNWSEKSTR